MADAAGRASASHMLRDSNSNSSLTPPLDVTEEAKRRKRARPSSKPNVSAGAQSDLDPVPSPSRPQTHNNAAQLPAHPPSSSQSQSQSQSRVASQTTNTAATSAQATPAKATASKPVVKALPTVRDHTTDVLGPEGDEYIPREHDDAGEKKVSSTGRLSDAREYRCRTFFVPNRGNKLFMLATECARVLGYRDSYLLFNKNRSLFKIIATQAEKDDLIHQEILPYSYRSRQIAIVTAKSMFRQFGSRVITNGRRVRDDYWEAKARKQGFTEEDLAGEKRPGGAKAAREAAAAQEAANNAGLGQQGPNIIYNNDTHLPLDAQGHHQIMQSGLPGGMAPIQPTHLPMILTPTEDYRSRDYNNIARPRQEITGTAYTDRTQPSSNVEIMNHATHAKDYNSAINAQRVPRQKYNEEHWRREVSQPSMQSPHSQDASTANISQSPQIAPGGMMSSGQQSMMQQQSNQQQQMMNATQPYPQPLHQQPAVTQSPSRPMPQQIRTDQAQQPHRSSSLNYSTTSQVSSQTSPYVAYPQQQQPHTWGQPPPAPQQSPLSTHHPGLPQYPQQPPSQTAHQPHTHPSQSPHLAQSPHQPPPSLQHQQSSASSMHSSMGVGGYPGMPNMASAGVGQGYGSAAAANMAGYRGYAIPQQHQQGPPQQGQPGQPGPHPGQQQQQAHHPQSASPGGYGMPPSATSQPGGAQGGWGAQGGHTGGHGQWGGQY
ncbi:hypothetical protein MMC25_006667 [Agyrium rufum]|nr:hypothetical protein [Agyrium rufum]